MNMKKEIRKAADRTAWSPMKFVSSWGVRSSHAYTAGLLSVGVSFISWLISRGKSGDSKSQSDRWGIFVGQWAPTFLALGVGLKLDEDKS